MKLYNLLLACSFLALAHTVALADSHNDLATVKSTESALDYGYGAGAEDSLETSLSEPSGEATSPETVLNQSSEGVFPESAESPENGALPETDRLPVDVIAENGNSYGDPILIAVNPGQASPSNPQPASIYANSPPGPAEEFECIEDEVDNIAPPHSSPLPGGQSGGNCGLPVTVTSTVVATSTQLVTTTCTVTSTHVIPMVTTLSTTVTKIHTQQVTSTVFQTQTQRVTQIVDRTVTKTRGFTITQTLPAQCPTSAVNPPHQSALPVNPPHQSSLPVDTTHQPVHTMLPECSAHNSFSRHGSNCQPRQPSHPSRTHFPVANGYSYGEGY